MRKNIKTKVSLIGIAWMLIFLHGIIPHNHSDDISHLNNNIIHNESGDDVNPEDDNTVLLSHPDNHLHGNVCHFSTNLFFRFAPDHFFITTSVPDITSVRFHVIATVASIESYFIRPPLITSRTLRAPPSV
ncbi:MAG: hypothetical protein K8R35_08420 [Bacteroidales bacterium]|nr:hypothetical protein [Bacteroidales bacterium]